MRINHNLSAVVANDNLLHNEDRLTTALERLSSGLKINQAKDNPTGMAMSIKMQAQIDGLNKATDNSEDGISMLQTADGALNEVTEMLQRMRELAIQAANGTNSVEDRESIQLEIDALKEEVDRISKDTDFNGTTLLDGSMDTRVYTTNPNVKKYEISAEVSKGVYSIQITQKPEYAKIEADAGSLDFSTLDDTTAAGLEGTITINDLSITLTKADTQADIYMKIRECSENAGAKAEIDETDGHIIFRSAEMGSDVDLTVAISNDEIKNYLGLTMTSESETATGADVKASLGAGFEQTATAIGAGDKLSITDMGGFEMVLKIGDKLSLDQADPADPSITYADVDIDVTGIGTMTLQIGSNKGQTLEVKIPDLGAESLGIDKLNYLNETSIGRAIEKLDDAINKLSKARANLGAYENRLEHTSSSLSETVEDMTNALSRVTDVDMAEEMSEYTNLQVLTQAGTSVLAQANQLPEQVLQMLQ